MRHLDSSAISDTVGMPFKAGTFTHLQLAYSETIAEAVKAIIGGGIYDNTKAYILQGCLNTGSGSNYNISAGSVFFAGEVYLVDASAFSITGNDVAVGAITNAYYSDGDKADPVNFTDGIGRNIHQVLKIAFAPGLSGSGASDYNNLIDLKKRPSGGIGQYTYWKCPGSLSDYFNSTGLGIHDLSKGWAIPNGQNGTDDLGGLFPVPYKANDTLFGSIGNSGGSKTHQLSINEMPSHSFLTVKSGMGDNEGNLDATRTTNASKDNGQANAYILSGNAGIADAGKTNTLGEDAPFSILNPYKVVLFIFRVY